MRNRPRPLRLRAMRWMPKPTLPRIRYDGRSMGLVMRLVCALLIAAVATAHADPPPQQKIALTAKPSVVRVWGAYVATYEIAGQRIPECCAVGGSGGL